MVRRATLGAVAVLAMLAGLVGCGSAGAAPDNTSCTSGDHPQIFYVMVTECSKNITGVAASVSVPSPVPSSDSCGTHSNAQITLQQGLPGGKTNAIEASWVVYPWDSNSVYFQVGRTVGSQSWFSPLDYPSLDWKSNGTNLPQPLMLTDTAADGLLIATGAVGNSRVTGRSSMKIWIAHSTGNGGEWKVLVDDIEVGHYLDSAWGKDGFTPTRAAWWGEVGTKPGCSGRSNDASCVAMGNGKLGADEQASSFTNLTVTSDGSQQGVRDIHVTDPNLYDSDRYFSTTSGDEAFIGNAFRFGGPGACTATTPTTETTTTSSPVPAVGSPNGSGAGPAASNEQNVATAPAQEPGPTADTPTTGSGGTGDTGSPCPNGMVGPGPDAQGHTGCYVPQPQQTTAPAPPPAPHAPTGLTATALNATTIQLTWAAPDDPSSFEINNGDVSRSAGGGSRSFNWTGLAPGTYMCFKIRATSSAGTSTWSPATSPYYVCTTTPKPAASLTPAPSGPQPVKQPTGSPRTTTPSRTKTPSPPAGGTPKQEPAPTSSNNPGFVCLGGSSCNPNG